MAVSFPFLPVIIYASLNIMAFTAFTHDKIMAKINRGRNSEKLLLFLAAVGPFGALTAMVGFRHKTRHTQFLLEPVFALLHLLLVVTVCTHIAG